MRDLPFLKDRYAISVDGQVWDKKQKKFLSQTTNLGYKLVNLWNSDGWTKKFQVHRLVAETYLPNPDMKPNVNHKDGIKSNNSAENLEWCTQAENVKHFFANATPEQLERHRKKSAESGHLNCKLTQKNKEEILAAFTEQRPKKKAGLVKQFAAKFCVTEVTIYSLLRTDRGTVLCSQS